MNNLYCFRHGALPPNLPCQHCAQDPNQQTLSLLNTAAALSHRVAAERIKRRALHAEAGRKFSSAEDYLEYVRRILE